ncbi:MAG: TonB-dependent receptor [Cyclobacteriaceae bacterium]
MITKPNNYAIWLRSVFLISFITAASLITVAQEKRVGGTVIDEETGEGLPGVSVVIQGTTDGTITDIEGRYSLLVEPSATLSFSFIGYAAQNIKVGDLSVIDVTLAVDIQSLEEVVVVGYGTQKKSDLTGSVVSISGDALKKVPVSTVAESLTGRLAGVQITSSEGSPDAEINIRVRGGASLTQGSNPLYIVDGFPVSTISDLSPSDIKSIDVLKDASSTAIYGSRGANGVVIITTKTGTKGKVTVNYNSFYAVKKMANKLDVLSPVDYARWQYEYAMLDSNDENDDGTPDISSYEDYFGLFGDLDLYENQPANDWQSQIYGRTGSTFSNDLSVRGGGENFNYSVNFARFEDKAIMIGSDYVRNNITLKFNNKASERVDLNFSLRYSDTEINGGGANEQNEVSSADSRLKHTVGYAPIPVSGLSVPDDTNEQISSDLVNPIISTKDNDRTQGRTNYNISGGINWNVIDPININSSFTVDTYNYLDSRFYGVTTYKARDRSPAYPNLPSALFTDRKVTKLRNTNTISYEVIKNQDHNLKVMLGHEILFTQQGELEYEIQGYPELFSSEEAFKLTTQGYSIYADNFQSADDKLVSFFGRANYDYKDRYLVTAVYRVDGSSRFRGNNVWGYFPSISGGWKLSEESFLSGQSNWINLLKLRASYGIAGNNNIPTAQTEQAFFSTNTNYINDVNSYWAPSRDLSNPDLKWETTETKNVGMDFGFFKGRVDGTIELYKNNTKDLLVRFPLAGAGGYDYQYRNIGETENQGLELTLGVIPIDKPDYGLSMNFNIAFNQNKILSLGGALDELDPNVTSTGWASSQIGQDFKARVGNSIGLMYGYVNDGRYEVDDFESYDEANDKWILKEGVANSDGILTPRPGMMKLLDLDGNDTITLADQRVVGKALPKHVGGFVLNAYAYGFDLTAAFNWSYGNDIYNANKVEFTTANQNNQYRNLITDQAEGKRWTNIDWNTGELVTDPDQLAAINANTTMWSPYMDRYIFSDWAVEDGSFLRLNTLTLGYTLPKSLIEKAKIENLRFYVTGYNLFVLTNYSGFDPEVSTRRKTPLTPGVDYSAYPRSRQFTVGMNLTF